VAQGSGDHENHVNLFAYPCEKCAGPVPLARSSVGVKYAKVMAQSAYGAIQARPVIDSTFLSCTQATGGRQVRRGRFRETPDGGS
jgi:hypothetical protein